MAASASSRLWEKPADRCDVRARILLAPLVLAAGVGAYVVAVVAAGLLAAALSRRFAPAGTLKMGET